MPAALRLPHTQRTGFTLLEFAIVLTIISFVVGGLIVGQSMVRSAQLQSVIREYDATLKAVKAFEDKYKALPGDFTRATNMWGARNANNALCFETAATSNVSTCNGDGNGRIGSSTTAGVLSNTQEWFLAWQHLSNSRLLDGHYNGVGIDISTAALDVTIPSSQVTDAGWMFGYYLNNSTTTEMWGDKYGHVFRYGSITTDGTTGGVLSPQEALEIDEKMDDGIPGTGTVRTWRYGYNSTCTIDDAALTARDTIYDTGIDAPVCPLLFLANF